MTKTPRRTKHSMGLLAAAIALSPLATAGTAAAVDTYVFRYKGGGAASPGTPPPVAFAPLAGAAPGVQYTSSVASLGNGSAVGVSVTGAMYRICQDSDCAKSPAWTSLPETAPAGSHVQLLAVGPASGRTHAATLAYGQATASWTVTSAALPGAVSISSMGVTDAALRSALEAQLGSGVEWVPCSFRQSSGAEACTNTAETLVVYTKSSTGAEFGAYARANMYVGQPCWAGVGGFYFSNSKDAARPAFLLDAKGGTNMGYGILACGSDLDALDRFGFADPIGRTSNVLWKTGYTLTGAAHGVPVASTVQAYKR